MAETRGDGGAQIIGRKAELARIDAFLDQAKTGNGQLLTLIGPAGVGKSRLIAEAGQRAQVRGFRVLQGTASPYQEDLSYAPLVEALRPLVHEGQQLSSRHLFDGLVDLCRLFPDLPLGPPDPLLDAGLERTRLAEAVWRLLTRASRQRPLLVVLEDLHCADSGTIATLGYLSRGLKGFPLLLLAASRPVNDSNGAAAQFLTGTTESTHLDVRPLDAPNIALLLEQRLGAPASAELISLIETRTRGVPLFVLGLLTTLVDSGRLTRAGGSWAPLPGADRGIPAGAAEFFETRLAAMSAADRRLIQAIAVCGDAATVDVLRQVSAVADAEARLADLGMKGAVAEQVSDNDVLWATTHPLLAEVAYQQLPESARRAMHAKAAHLVQERWPADVSRLAAHVARAGREIIPDEALAVLSSATSVALQRLAGAEAMRHAEAAVAIAERCGRHDVLGGLYKQLAEGSALAGHPELSVDSYVAAASRAVGPVEQARLLRKAGTIAWQLGRFDAAHSHLTEAANLLRELDAVDERILVAEQRIYFANRETNYREMEGVRAELRTLATVHPMQPFNRAHAVLALSPRQLTEVGSLLAFDYSFSDEAVDRAARLGDPVFLHHLHRPWIAAALLAGDIAAARRRAEVARDHAQRFGPAIYEVGSMVIEAWAEYLSGEWDRAFDIAGDADTIAYRSAVPRERTGALALRAFIVLHRGQTGEARRILGEARRIFGVRDRHIAGTLDSVDTFLCLATGNVGRAVELASGLRFPSSGQIPLLSQQARCEAFLAAGDLVRARAVVALLQRGAHLFPLVTAQVARFEGLLAGADEDRRAAREKLSAASGQLTSLGLPFEAALAELELAEFTSDPVPAEQALAVFDRLAAKPFADRARQLLRRLGQPAAAPPRKSDGSLSDREREVALLVAQGLTNAAIGERLFISPRTVTTHLERIYRRLGVQSRTALTRYVMEHFPDA